MGARSGEPYTMLASPEPGNHEIIGSVNGARMPWHFAMDLRLDKDFVIPGFSFKKKQVAADGTPIATKKPRSYTVNGYLMVKNLLNIRDIVNVYGYTGDPQDDGYLSSSYGKQQIPIQTNAQSYTDLYTLSKQDPANLGLPRQIYLGLQFNF
jgi:hypothetical protein